MRIAFAAPAYWPAQSFGGPVWVLRELAGGLVRRGHAVDVFTTSLTGLERRGTARTRVELVDGARVHYLATPLRFRWMGLTPSLPLALLRAARPDVAHVFGFRDPLGTAVAAWCRARGIPYVFEPLGMFGPKLRKVVLKRALDKTILRGVVGGAELAIATSQVERRELLAGGVPAAKIAIRPNGFPEPVPPASSPSGVLRGRLGVDAATPLLLYVGRVARGKGLDLLLEALRTLPDVELAIVGPDGGHGMTVELLRLRERLGLDGRVHLLGPEADRPLDLYADADAFVLPSRHENFGMVAAEAAAAGTASVVTDRCGVAELLRDRGAIVVPYEAGAIRDALGKVLADEPLRRRLGEGGQQVARELSWPNVVAMQEELYERIAS